MNKLPIEAQPDVGPRLGGVPVGFYEDLETTSSYQIEEGGSHQWFPQERCGRTSRDRRCCFSLDSPLQELALGLLEHAARKPAGGSEESHGLRGTLEGTLHRSLLSQYGLPRRDRLGA